MPETRGQFEHLEPSAELRQFAGLCFSMYTALVKEGFTEKQAMEIIGATIAANMGGKS